MGSSSRVVATGPPWTVRRLHTTLVVAAPLRRRLPGFELSSDYAAAIRQRLEAARPGQPLEGSPEPTIWGKGRVKAARKRSVSGPGIGSGSVPPRALIPANAPQTARPMPDSSTAGPPSNSLQPP